MCRIGAIGPTRCASCELFGHAGLRSNISDDVRCLTGSIEDTASKRTRGIWRRDVRDALQFGAYAVDQEVSGSCGPFSEGLDRVPLRHELIGNGGLFRRQRTASRHDQAARPTTATASATTASAATAVVQR